MPLGRLPHVPRDRITAYLANGGAESRAKGIAHAKAAIEQLLHGVYKQAA
jgi:hypothetical protein